MGKVFRALVAVGLIMPSAAGALPASDINPQPRAALRQGGHITWALDQFPTQWNYNQYNGAESATYDVMVNDLMPEIFLSDARGRIHANPDYVTRAQARYTPKQVVTLDLNPAAHWSDGVPITARDFVGQWKAMRGRNHHFAVGSTTGYERIAGVRAGTSAHQVVITFAKRFSEWRSLYAPLYPAKTTATPRAFNRAYLNRIPITGGPFRIGTFSHRTQTVKVVRNPAWWGDPPLLDSITFRARSGPADYRLLGFDPAGYRRAKQHASIRVAGGPDFRHLTFNGASRNLSDVRVRRAIAMGIDRAALMRSDLSGLPGKSGLMDNHLFVNTQAGYRDNAGAIGRFSPKQAAALLQHAGWRRHGAHRTKGGRRLKLRYVVPSGIPFARREAVLTKRMLARIGVSVTIDTVPSDDYFDRYILLGRYDITAFSWLGTPFPISPNRSIYIQPRRRGNGTPAYQQNFARVGSQKIDALFGAAIATPDTARQHRLLNQADALIWKEVHSIILFQTHQIVAVNPKLANLGARGLGDVRYQDIGFAP